MIKQKQSRLDNVEKRIAAMTNVIQSLMDEINNLKTISFSKNLFMLISIAIEQKITAI